MVKVRMQFSDSPKLKYHSYKSLTFSIQLFVSVLGWVKGRRKSPRNVPTFKPSPILFYWADGYKKI